MKWWVSISILILMGVIAGTFWANSLRKPETLIPTSPPTVQAPAPVVSPKKVNIQVDIPRTLRIPALGVEAPVELVGLDKAGRMDIPKKVMDVAWYDLGYKPGENGSAVIAGHLDDVVGVPAIFYNLSRLKKGDEVIVEDIKGTERRFKVSAIEVYPVNEFPLQQVFGSSKAGLNLITCQGTFTKSVGYDHRVVVYTELGS